MTSDDPTVKLIRSHELHEVHHVLADMTCVFCRIEDAIAKISDRSQRFVMWDHYHTLTDALQK